MKENILKFIAYIICFSVFINLLISEGLAVYEDCGYYYIINVAGLSLSTPEQVLLNITKPISMNTNCSDVRITYSNTTDIPFYFNHELEIGQCDTNYFSTYAKIYGNDTIKVYYNCTNDTHARNINNTFIEASDIGRTDGITTDDWKTIEGAPAKSITNNILTVSTSGGGANNVLTRVDSGELGHESIELIVLANVYSDQVSGGEVASVHGYYTDVDHRFSIQSQDVGASTYNGFITRNVAQTASPTPEFTVGTWYKYNIYFNLTQVDFYQNNTFKFTSTTNIPNSYTYPFALQTTNALSYVKVAYYIFKTFDLNINLTNIGESGNNNYWSVLYNNYTSPVFQLSDSEFGLSINTTQLNITSVNINSIVWNNTIYNSSYITDLGNVSDGSYNIFSYNISLDIPFVRTNNTSVSYFWNYSIVWQNGTLTNDTTTPNNQYIYWNNWINTVSQNKEEFIEYEELVTSVNITDKLGGTPNVTVLFNNVWNDLTLVTTTGDYKVYTGSITVPPPESGIVQNYVWNVSLFYSNTTFTTEQSSIDYNATSYTITVTNCSDTNETALVYYFLDEESINSNITSDMDIDINLTSDFNFWKSYSFEFRDVTNASICIYPPNATYYADSIQQYWADDYRVRSYFLQNATLDNTTNYINLYQINETFADATGVTFKVTLSNNFPAERYITKIQRYYVGLGSYITVAMVLTDNNGEGFTYVRKNDVWYKFITEKDYTVVDETDLTIVSGDTFPIIVGGGEVADYVFNSGDILSGCEYTNATGVLTCTVSDPSNLASEVCLLVKKTGFNGYDICDTCVAGSPTTTIVCTVPLADRIDSILYYSLTVNDVWFMEDGGYIDLSVVEDFGKTGLLISYMVVGTLFFIGVSFEPIIGLILGTAGLYIGIQTELLKLDYGAFVGFALIVAIAIFKLKNKSEVSG